MSYYDPTKDYSRGGVRDFLDAGAYKTGAARVDQIADMEALIGSTGINMQQKYGAIDEATAEQMRKESEERVAAGHASNMDVVNSLSTKNTILNSAGLVLSAFNATGTFGAKAIAGKMVGSSSKLLQAGSHVFNGLARTKFLTKAGLSLAPIAATQAYTRNETAKANVQWDQTLNSLQASYDYLTSEDESLSEAVKEQTSGWTNAYEAGTQELLRQLDAGEISQEEYNDRYEQFVEAQHQSLEEIKASHAETAKAITEHGVAYATDEYIADHGYDIDKRMEQSQVIRKMNEDHPELYEKTKSVLETKAQMSTGSAFTDFLANINATLLHYVPGLAYVEAAVVKAGDVLMDFAANKIPVLSSVLPYEEKHKGEGIGEIAKAICTDAEARYELSHSAGEEMRALREGREAASTEGMGREAGGAGDAGRDAGERQNGQEAQAGDAGYAYA